MPVSMPRLKSSERPRPADDARERRVLTDDELACVLNALCERERLYFRTLAETGARMGEILGLTRRRIGTATITFAEQRGRDGEPAPLKTRTSKRAIEITRSLAAALALAGEVPFAHLTHASVDHTWRRALKRAGIADPQPTIHDLRHTHVSTLIADGWDPVEIAARIGDTLATTLSVYSHEFDVRRRGEQRRRALEARYDAGMATYTPPQGATAANGGTGEVADLQAVRDGWQ
jgi:integrase